MGQCRTKLPHSCGTRRGLQVYSRPDGGVDGYCWSCKTYVRHPYGEERKAEDLPEPEVKTLEEIEAEIAEIDVYPVVDVAEKRLRASALNYYGVKTGLSEEDGKTPRILCYPYTRDGVRVGYKVKVLENKRIWSVGSLKDVDLFGWEEALKSGARRLIITEGEDDAVSLYRVLQMYSKEAYKDYTAVCSLPNGVHSAKDYLVKNFKKIQQHFKEVSISFDMDEPGRKAVEDVCSVISDITSIDLPSKDANQCVIDGKAKAMYNSLYKPQRPKNTRLVIASEIAEEAKEVPKFGDLTWPWEHINKATRGLRYGETIYIGGPVKMGKSEVVNALAAHFIREHGVKVLLAKPEESLKKSYKMLAGKIVGRCFHDPEVEFDAEAYDRATKIIGDKAIFINSYQQLSWEVLKQDIIACSNIGARVVFIDPITNLTVGMDSGEVNTKLNEIAVEAAALAKDLNILIFLFCHLRAHDGNISREKREKLYKEGKYIGLGTCPHEFGGDITSNQFAGSRAMMRSCHMMIGLEGNKDPELEDNVRNIRNLKILEDREFGVTGVYPLYWNRNSTLFEEI